MESRYKIILKELIQSGMPVEREYELYFEEDPCETEESFKYKKELMNNRLHR